MSDMTGTKAVFMEQRCRDRGQAFIRFDYSGHGQSEGAFRDGTIGQWAEDAMAVLQQLTDGPQIIIGSSMGGWIALLLAKRAAQRVHGLIGIAAAPDFTEDLMWPAFTEEQRLLLTEWGYVEKPTEYGDDPYVITKSLIEDGRRNLVLRDTIQGTGPVRLLQGMEDEDVPWETAIKLTKALATDDCRVSLIKDGDHRLARAEDLEILDRAVQELNAFERRS